MHGRRLDVALVLVSVALAACAGGGPSTTPSSSSPITTSSKPTAEAASWATDLAQIDGLVRTHHPAPWEIHSEVEWEATLARVAGAIGDAETQNGQMVAIAELVGLLDSHSGLLDVPGGWHFYELLPYRFSDGWFIVRAADESLIGGQLLSIGGVAIDDVVERLSPLVPHDNANGLLMNVLWLLNSVEYLDGTGIVADEAHPALEVARPDGTTVAVDPPIVDVEDYHLVNPGWLNGPAPEAVARRGEHIWTRLESDGIFLISVNDYGDMTAAAAELKAVLDAGLADRVVLDMRYLPGGNGDISILETLTDEPRVNREGGLIVLTGRENVSIATQVVYFFDRTSALLVGEATPARASNFTCPCQDVTLRHSGFVVSVPTSWDNPGDPRSEIVPDVPMALSATDFFAGRDPVLEAALSGTLPSPAP